MIINCKGWNSHVHRGFPRKFDSANLSRDNLSREIGRTRPCLDLVRINGPWKIFAEKTSQSREVSQQTNKTTKAISSTKEAAQASNKAAQWKQDNKTQRWTHKHKKAVRRQIKHHKHETQEACNNTLINTNRKTRHSEVGSRGRGTTTTTTTTTMNIILLIMHIQHDNHIDTNTDNTNSSNQLITFVQLIT